MDIVELLERSRMISKFLARQLSKPSKVIGPLVLAQLWIHRNKALNDAALRLLAFESGDNALEVGFGGGYLLGEALVRVTHGLVAGIDVSAAMTDHCRSRYQHHILAGKLELQCASVSKIPYGDKRFNKVYSVNSLFYWPDVRQGIQECWRVMVEGGTLVLVFTSSASLKGKSFARHGLVLHDGADIATIMRDIGFEVTQVEEASDAHRSYWCVVGSKVTERS